VYSIAVLWYKYTSRQEQYQSFVKKYPTPAMPCNRTIYRIVDKISVVGSVLHQMKLHKCHALTEEKLDNRNTVMKTSPQKYLCLLVHQSGVKIFSSLSNKTFKNYGHTPSSGVVRKKPVLQAVSTITNGFS